MKKENWVQKHGSDLLLYLGWGMAMVLAMVFFVAWSDVHRSNRRSYQVVIRAADGTEERTRIRAEGVVLSDDRMEYLDHDGHPKAIFLDGKHVVIR